MKNMIMTVIEFIKCWLGRHDWKDIDTDPYPAPKRGESILFKRKHQCSRCGKVEMKGMGWIV